jgi:hypothetical protein
MNLYYFHFQQEDGELYRDRLGMYLPSLAAAQEEVRFVARELLAELPPCAKALCDCAFQIADASGETVLTVPLVTATRLH